MRFFKHLHNGNYIEAFTRCHAVMEGATFDEYKSWAEEDYLEMQHSGDINAARVYIYLINEWLYYWKVVAFFRDKGYPLKSLEECGKMEKRIVSGAEFNKLEGYPTARSLDVPSMIARWRALRALRDNKK